MLIDEDFIIDSIGLSNYIQAKNDKDSVLVQIRKQEYGSFKNYTYEVNSKDNVSVVNIAIYHNSIQRLGCSCEDFKKHRRCKHCGLVFLDLFDVENVSDELDANNFFTSLENNLINNKFKELIDLKVVLNFDFESSSTDVYLKIGKNKLYKVGKKINHLYTSIVCGEGIVSFGKNFEYDPKIYRISDLDKSILSYLNAKLEYEYNKSFISLNYSETISFLRLIQNKSYEIEGYNISFKSYIESIPFNISLNKDENNYKFEFDFKDVKFLTSNNKWCIKDNHLYLIDSMIAEMISNMEYHGFKELSLNKDNAVTLSKFVSPIFKDNYLIDNELEDEFKVSVPKVRLYLDINDNIILKLMFLYKDKEINYFSKDLVFRNNDYEQEIINDLYSYNFVKNKKYFEINNINDIVDFINNSLIELKEKYEIFTTKKFDNMKVYNTSISSTFSIGKDNIINYEFNMDGIDPKEVNKLIDVINTEERYYKLRSGDIINLQNQNLMEFKDVFEKLSIDDFDIH